MAGLRTPTPGTMLHICSYCGIWKNGPWEGRFDVPIEEVRRELERRSGGPSPDKLTPTPYREGGTFYDGGGNGFVSHGSCEACNLKYSEGNAERRERIARAIRPPEETITEPEKPEPTEEEARKFLMGQDDDPKKDEGEE